MNNGELRVAKQHAVEYACRPIYWVLAGLIIAYYIVTNEISDHKMKSSRQTPAINKAADPDATTLAEATLQPRENSQNKRKLTLCIAPHLTTQARRATAIVFLLAIFGVELLEAYWVVKTHTRVTVLVFSLWYDFPESASDDLYGQVIVMILGVLYADRFVIRVGGSILRYQVGCIIELMGWVPTEI